LKLLTKAQKKSLGLPLDVDIPAEELTKAKATKRKPRTKKTPFSKGFIDATKLESKQYFSVIKSMVESWEEGDFPQPLMSVSGAKYLYDKAANIEPFYFLVGFWTLPYYGDDRDMLDMSEIVERAFVSPGINFLRVFTEYIVNGAVVAFVEAQRISTKQAYMIPLYENETIDGFTGVGKSPPPKPDFRRKKDPRNRGLSESEKRRRANDKRNSKNRTLRALGIKVNKGDVKEQKKRARERKKNAQR
jgi:hypothetical protein